MILVDTSVWIDHLHKTERQLVEQLEVDEVGGHPAVIEELALGSIAQGEGVLSLLGSLRQFPALRHDEILALVGNRRLWGRGLSAVDAHLLGSVALVTEQGSGRATNGCSRPVRTSGSRASSSSDRGRPLSTGIALVLIGAFVVTRNAGRSRSGPRRARSAWWSGRSGGVGGAGRLSLVARLRALRLDLPRLGEHE